MPIFSSPPAGGAPAARWLRNAAFALAIGALGGCRDTGDITGSIGSSGSQQALPTSDADLRAYADDWAKRYDANPGEKIASMNYARALRALTRYAQAAAVMQAAAVKAPKDMEVLGAYGKALADAGQFEQAADVLSRSYTPERPNWSSMSVQGSIADQLGDHAKAQDFYRDALKIAPGEPNVLSNLGLSYALTKQLPLAEQVLRQAAESPRADARVRDNLALVLSLEGKFGEAEQVERQDRSAQAAAANVASIRQMIAQSNSWRDIQTLDARKHGVKPAPAKAAPDSAVPVADRPAG
ncbi:tetratricopeptide repeat protein [Methylocapsa sp. S129]|uniref:tetratricopeptide repeat protein n=1 Tax=Methylocapsa sp. S129 TaxID=1641869 RepID=UPI00131CB820|nr:tetratricopeptide repeat protein [Methylocapsa sp. S129]